MAERVLTMTPPTNGAHPPALPHAATALNVARHNPLFHDGWLEFNHLRWGVEPRRVRLAAEPAGLPAVEAVYYLDRHGRIWKPPTSTYLPIAFMPTATRSA